MIGVSWNYASFKFSLENAIYLIANCEYNTGRRPPFAVQLAALTASTGCAPILSRAIARPWGLVPFQFG